MRSIIIARAPSLLYGGLLASIAFSCTGIHSADDLGEPLIVFEGSIEGQAPVGLVTSTLQAALIWAEVPSTVGTCLEDAETAETVQSCLASNVFAPALASRSVDITPVFPAAFELPLYTLPGTEVLSGNGNARFGYGVLAVYDDGNQNRVLDLVPPEATDSIDTVIAASLREQQHGGIDFVVYREGELSPLWKMFSFAGCPEELPSGFSVVHISSSEGCVVGDATDRSLSLYFDDSEELRDLLCEPQVEPSSYPDSAPPQEVEFSCQGSSALEFVADPSRYCKQVVTFELAGCDHDPICAEPEWDLRPEPPTWWPCTGDISNGFQLTDSPGALTSAGGDALFKISNLSDDQTYDLSIIEIWVETEPSKVTSLYAPEFVTHVDNDEDGLLSIGDELLAFEPETLSILDDSNAGPLTVSLVRETGPSSVVTLAELIWNPAAN